LPPLSHPDPPQRDRVVVARARAALHRVRPTIGHDHARGPMSQAPALVIKLTYEGAVEITTENCTGADIDRLAYLLASDRIRAQLITWARVAAGHEPPDLDGSNSE
jgi:hypothetical protein